MKTRKLGRSGLAVSAIGLGLYVPCRKFLWWTAMTPSLSTTDRPARYELGINLLDTSDVYGPVTQ